MQALSQLSYSPPFFETGREDSGKSGQTINPRATQFKGNLSAGVRLFQPLGNRQYYACARLFGRR